MRPRNERIAPVIGCNQKVTEATADEPDNDARKYTGR